MHALVKTAFSRLYDLDAAEEERKLADNDSSGPDGEAKMTVSTSPQTAEHVEPTSEAQTDESTPPESSPPSELPVTVTPETITSGPRSKCMSVLYLPSLDC